MKSLKVIVEFGFFLVLILGGIYFGSQNVEPVRIMVLGKLLEPLPLWMLMLVSFGLGSVLAGCFFSYELVKLWLEAKRLRKESDKDSTTLTTIDAKSIDKGLSASSSSFLKSSSGDLSSGYDSFGSPKSSPSTSVRPSYVPPSSIRPPSID